MHFLSFNFLSFIAFFDISAVIEIFKDKDVKNIIVFHCSQQNQLIEPQRLFHLNNFHSLFVSINNNISWKLPNSYSKVGILMNTSCGEWRIIQEFQSPSVWVYYTENFNSTIKTLATFPIEINSDVTVVHKENEVYQIFEVFSTGYKNKGIFKVDYVGMVNSKLQSNLHFSRRVLNGVNLKCTIVFLENVQHQTFEQNLKRGDQTKWDSLHKLKFFTLLKYLGEMYNITYDLIRTNSWGYPHDNNFDGMVGSLQRQEADVGGSSVFFRTDRTYAVDYVGVTWPSKQSFIFRHPKHPSGFFSIYTRPLTNSVWYCVISLIFITAATVRFMLRVNIERLGRETSPSLAVLFAWSALCQQGMSLSRNSVAVKLVIFFTFVYSATLYQYYVATILSTLLKESPITIRSLKDLLQSDLKAGVEDVVYVRDFLTNTKDPVAIELYQKKITAGNQLNFLDPEVGMSKVKKGGFAFHVDTAYSYSIMKKAFTEREICEIHDVSMYLPQKMGAVLKKGSPYKNYFAIGIRRLWEAGLMQRMKSVRDEHKPPCVQTPNSSIFSVSILEFSMPLFAIVFGIMTSLLVLLCEIFWNIVSNK